jgi:aminotransferase
MNLSMRTRQLSDAISIRYNNLVYEMKSRGEDVTVLSLGEAYFEIPLFDFRALPTPDLYHYSHSRGILSLREKIAEYYAGHYGVSADPGTQVLVTAGSKIGILYALYSLVNPGDEVILFEPYWVSYSEQVQLVGGIPISIPVSASVSDLTKFVSKRTRIVIVNNPQNPTGKNYSHDELIEIFRFAEKFDLWIISDEAYSDFVPKEERFISFGAIDKDFSRSIIVNSISKNFGLSGWRVGYMLAKKEITDSALTLTQHSMTCAPTALLMYIDKYFSSILSHTKPQILKLVEMRERVNKEISQLELIAISGTSTFYFFVNIGASVLSSTEFCDRLLGERRVAAVPGIGYGKSCDKYIRVSIGTETEPRIISALNQIKSLIEVTQP